MENSKPRNLTFPEVFRHFYDDFEDSLKTIENANGILKFISFLSCFSTFFTILIVWNASSRLKIEYRNILLSQLILAFSGCFLISFISPTFLLPYPLIFVSTAFHISHQVTLYLSSIVVMLYFFPTMIFLSFGLIYNFMSLKQLGTVWHNISVDRILKITIFLITVILLAGNCVLISQVSGEKNQDALQKEVVEKVDPRCGKLFEKFAVFLFDIYSIPVKIASIEALALSIASIIFCAILTALSLKHFESQKPTLSPSAAKNHRMMMYMLISYVAHFLIYFSLPLAAFTVAIHDVKPFFGNLSFLIIRSPAHFLGISLSVTYCSIISPYRKVCYAFFLLLTCSRKARVQNSTSSPRVSIIDQILRRSNYRVSSST